MIRHVVVITRTPEAAEEQNRQVGAALATWPAAATPPTAMP
jgi:hypothetical protein